MPTLFFRRLTSLSRSLHTRHLRFPLLTYAQRIRAIYHVTHEKPQEVIQKGGFRCTDPNANIDIKTHVEHGGDSHYVSMTSDYELFLKMARVTHRTGVYVIDPRQLETIPVDYQKLEKWGQLYQGESEVLVAHRVPLDAVVGSVEVHPKYPYRTEPSWLNPHYNFRDELAKFFKEEEKQMIKEDPPPSPSFYK